METMLAIKHLIPVLSIVSSTVGIEMLLLFNPRRHLSYCNEQGHTEGGFKAMGFSGLVYLDASLKPTVLDLPSETVAHAFTQP